MMMVLLRRGGYAVDMIDESAVDKCHLKVSCTTMNALYGPEVEVSALESADEEACSMLPRRKGNDRHRLLMAIL